MPNTLPDASSNERKSNRDLLRGRVGKAGAFSRTVAPRRKGGVPSGQADKARHREFLQRIEELSGQPRRQNDPYWKRRPALR